ncbi:4-hydroxythreonine-4-phosphate dehydrogenase [Catenovulum agarivorans DS-2]|uniref:3-oxo-tetronate kinase n=1 Tax=Catenovulum agarivorans DS-2 TaxID=1328313 RepID=W7QL25_9ALTE|nr:3-oxo-tetronate kinase [Catenovulum agarivorans]EWH08828.1 4-hydroxythreonine-4-phosphate dehydrogenase [Catenovulum agarivorans DS-2]
MTVNEKKKPILGAIADDFTGASDLASFLLKGGLKVVQINGVPSQDIELADDVDAIVVALKSRTCAINQAISDSTASLAWLQQQGCQKFYFKYCSTFDSTSEGNIGPVTQALLAKLESEQTIFCPALPVNGRTVYQGHLFVFEQLLSDSPLRNHPLTPMLDSNLIRLLQPQLAEENAQRLQLMNLASLHKRPAYQKVESAYWVVDCVNDNDLEKIAQLFATNPDYPLLTGGSGLGEYMAREYVKAGWLQQSNTSHKITKNDGKTLILAGSCSQATRKQIDVARTQVPTLALDVDAIATGQLDPATVLGWINMQHSEAVVLYTSAEPEKVLAAQAQFGKEQVSEKIEQCLTQIAKLARENNILNIVVAGGETSGAIVSGLNLTAFTVGQSICPGVPVMQSHHADGLIVALKSGNFGDENFFLTALETIQ